MTRTRQRTNVPEFAVTEEGVKPMPLAVGTFLAAYEQLCRKHGMSVGQDVDCAFWIRPYREQDVINVVEHAVVSLDLFAKEAEGPALQYLFEERDGLDAEEVCAWHVVHVDPLARGKEYMQVKALEALRKRILRHTQEWSKDEQFVGYRNRQDPHFHCLRIGRMEDIVRAAATDPKFTVYDQPVPTVVKHASAWSFFKAIDYDYLSRKLKGKVLAR